MAIETAFINWTNRSVLQFAKGRDPLVEMSDKAEGLVLKALEKGWSGPPYDPFELANLLRIGILPRDDLADARTIAAPNGGVLIEFNPRQPTSRIRFSIAHELAHTFFPDCLERARYRAKRSTYRSDDWQLEMLCNFGAAEILMPTGSFGSLRDEGFDINHLMSLRQTLQVSTEALLIRVVKLAQTPVACFVASWRNGKLKIDYSVFSTAWDSTGSNKLSLPDHTCINECTAIGYTAKARETWGVEGKKRTLHVQAVGLPPYPGMELVRVAGLIRPTTSGAPLPGIEYLIGDALEPRGVGRKVVAHVVNNATPRWGGASFAGSVKKKWPKVQEQFRDWAMANKAHLKLGATHIANDDEDISVVSMVAQHGYGPSEFPRIRYQPLERCLEDLAQHALKESRSIHIPRIGTGNAGGKWEIVEEFLRKTICSKGLRVFVYDLPR